MNGFAPGIPPGRRPTITNTLIDTKPPKERAFLIAVDTGNGRRNWTVRGSVEELERLATTAGAEIAGKMVQRLKKPTVAYYLGKGKLEELKQLKEDARYNVAIFDDELSPTQQRNIESALQVKVIDRSALILDIFARRAQTREGKIQVELAQHQYLLPRLAGQWSHLERLGGGIGTRGPGESQLETDRRLIQKRIHRLKGEIEDVRKHRSLYRRQRKRQEIPIVALVGYTNSGKSTLLNALSNASVLVEDKLFATLDPITRRLALPNKKEILLTDTVGFIQKMPPIVAAAFRATLEELSEADLLLHIIDITNEYAAEQNQTVNDILTDLGLTKKPIISVFNKIDLLGEPPFDDLDGKRSSALLISAEKGWGLDRLLDEIAKTLQSLELNAK